MNNWLILSDNFDWSAFMKYMNCRNWTIQFQHLATILRLSEAVGQETSFDGYG